MDAVDCRAL